MPKLSLMVPTLETRKPLFERLIACLTPQLTPDVELITTIDNGESSIGEKRNKLVAEAKGDYLAFIDDDDLVHDDYVKYVLQAISTEPDTVGFKLIRYVNGERADLAIHSLRYEKWGELRANGQIVYYERTPNHLNPTRAELVRQVPYKDKSWGEDSDYSIRLYPLLKSESFIDRELYIYLYRDSQQRAGEVAHRIIGGRNPSIPPRAKQKYKRPPRV